MRNPDHTVPDIDTLPHTCTVCLKDDGDPTTSHLCLDGPHQFSPHHLVAGLILTDIFAAESDATVLQHFGDCGWEHHHYYAVRQITDADARALRKGWSELAIVVIPIVPPTTAAKETSNDA